MKKRILAIVLCLTMVLTTGSIAFAAEEAVEPATEATEVVTTEEPTEADVVEPANAEESESDITIIKDELVGKTAWIKSGTELYKNYTDATSKTAKVPLNIKVVSAFESKDETKWYEIKLTGLSVMLAPYYGGYKYVKAKGVSETKPADSVDKEITVGDTTINVEGSIPEDVSLTATEVAEENYNANLEEYIDNLGSILGVFDIKLKNADGTVWQPGNGESVSVTLDAESLGLDDEDRIGIIHEDSEGNLADLGEIEIRDGKFTFETDGFSNFYFYLTFKFGDFEYTMSGNTEMYLSELLAGLNLYREANTVTNVTFTNPEVLEITQVGDDWLLKSLAPFGEEETLTITFNDGKVIEIAVKDPVVYNYAVGSNITNVPLLETKQHTVSSVNNGDQAALNQTYVVNKEKITVENVKSAGVAEKTAGKHPAPDATHMIIYAKEGMAIDFIGGTDWTYTGSKPTYAGSEIWFWSWESSVSANYVIVKDGTAGQQAKFTVTTTVDGTKYYCNVVLCVVENSSPTKLQDDLPEGYSIKNVPVTLYNYDGKAFNEYYNSKSGKYFAFASTVKGVNTVENAGNRGWTESGLQANGGGGVALMGILKKDLINGLPVMSQGQNVDVFSENSGNGKTVYPDVNFQFVYNDTTGYYTYNSALNHAQYNNSNKTIELYKQSLAPSDTPNGASHGNAGFYPFEDINKAYTNTGYTAISDAEWITKLEKNAFELIPSQYSTDIVQTNSTDPASTVDLHYGIQVASDFYMPKNKLLNGQEMIYEFTGDDDLWVFIDGKLVLDIGGGHTYVSGSFNLTTGEVWVEKYTQLASDDGGSYSKRVQGTDLRYTDSFLTGLQDDQMHTIQIFYLERHAGVSNCRMRFNLPLVPSNAVNISKNLANQDSEDLSITPDEHYEFTLYTAKDDDDTVDATNFTPYANKPYTVTGEGAPTGSQYTDSNGKFKLKDGWIATFEGIPRFTEVYAVENKPEDDYVYHKKTVSVNKATAVDYAYGSETEKKVMQLNSSINYDFVNYMKTQPLTISKEVVGGTDGLLDENQKFDFDITFGKDCVLTDTITLSNDEKISVQDKYNELNLSDEDLVCLGGRFELQHDESITIPKVPVNMTFTLEETDLDESFDEPKYEATKCTKDNDGVWTVNDDAENVINVVNQQRFDLVIAKNGIESVDHDNDTPTDENAKFEKQTTLFDVTGPNDFDTKVAICGNSEIEFGDTVEMDNVVVIKDLPVGTYSISEIADWSWRYGVKAIDGNSVVVEEEIAKIKPDEVREIVTFTNERNKIYWLNGGAYCQNVFK